MPTYEYQNPGVLETITRPVVKDIAVQILQMTGLPQDLQIQYPGDTGVMPVPASGINANTPYTTFDSTPQFQIVVEERAQRDRILSTAVLQADAPIIFQDPDHNVFAWQAYSPTEISLNITYRATDKDMALRWRNDIRMRVSMNREVTAHQLQYSYLFADDVLATLQQIWTMQEAVAPYGRDFPTYLTQYFDSRARQLSTLAGTELKWGVAETQGRVVGWFDFDGEPEEGSKMEGNAAWNISFSYKFMFDKPFATVLNYPLVIHNQMMPEPYRPTAAPPRPEDTQSTYSLSSGAFAHFEVTRYSQNRGVPGFAIPDFDDFMPRKGSIPRPTVRIATVLVQIDTTNPRLLLDMKNDFGDFALDPVIQDFMIGEGAMLAVMGQSLLNVSVYENDVLMHPSRYTVDNTLKVSLTVDPNLRSTYHVRLGMHTHPSQLYQAARTRMRTNCAAVYKLLTALCPGLITDGVITTCKPNNTMDMLEFKNALDYIDRRLQYLDWGSNVDFLTVMDFSIVAQRGN